MYTMVLIMILAYRYTQKKTQQNLKYDGDAIKLISDISISTTEYVVVYEKRILSYSSYVCPFSKIPIH